jgi:hypothetical protein
MQDELPLSVILGNSVSDKRASRKLSGLYFADLRSPSDPYGAGA